MFSVCAIRTWFYKIWYVGGQGLPMIPTSSEIQNYKYHKEKNLHVLFAKQKTNQKCLRHYVALRVFTFLPDTFMLYV